MQETSLHAQVAPLGLCCALALATLAAAPSLSGQTLRFANQPFQLSIAPANLTFDVGGSATLTVRLKGIAPSDLSVSLEAAGPANVVKLPARVVIRKSQSRATIKLRGEHPGGPVSVTATLPAAAGGASASAQVTVEGLRVSFAGSTLAAVVGDCSFWLFLSSPAPQGGLTVRLSQSGPANVIAVPATLYLAPGKDRSNFIIRGLTVGGPVMITATLPVSVGGASADLEVRVVPDW